MTSLNNNNFGFTTAIGFLTVTFGLWLVQLLLIGDISPRGSIDHQSEMIFGFHDWDFLILVVTAFGVATITEVSRRYSGALLMLTGSLVLATELYRALSMVGRDGVYGTAPSPFHLGVGFFVTICGCVLLLLAGSMRSLSLNEAEAKTPHTRKTSDRQSMYFSSVPNIVVLCVLVAISGFIVSTWLEWLVTVPGMTISPADAGLDTGPGFSTLDLGILGLVFTGLTVTVRLTKHPDWRNFAGRVLVLTGFLAGSIVLWRLLEGIYFVESGTYGGYYVAPGLYLSLLSALWLVVAGVLLSQALDPMKATRHLPYQPRLNGSVWYERVAAIPWTGAIVAVVGIGLILIGSWLDWYVQLGVNFGQSAKAASRIARQGEWLPLLALIGTPMSIAVAMVYPRRKLGGILLFSTGLTTIGLTVWWLVSATGTNGISSAGFVVASGVYMSLVGGTLLLLAGALVTMVATTGSSNN